jgi:CBS domain-containing protein
VLGRRTGELDVPVWGVCTRSVYVVDLDTRVDVIADALADRHIGSALVTRQGKLVGIVTTTDICRAYADLVREQAGPPPEGTDAA